VNVHRLNSVRNFIICELKALHNFVVQMMHELQYSYAINTVCKLLVIDLWCVCMCVCVCEQWFQDALSRVVPAPSYLVELLFSTLVPIHDFHRSLLKDIEQRVVAWYVLFIMVALCNRADHYIFAL